MDISYKIDFRHLAAVNLVGSLIYDHETPWALILSAVTNPSTQNWFVDVLTLSTHEKDELVWWVWQDWDEVAFLDLNGNTFKITSGIYLRP